MENPDKVREFLVNSPRWGAILQKLDFFNIYYSWWFMGLLGLMAFDVIVCKLIFGKFPGFKSFRSNERSLSIVSAQHFKAEWTDSNSPSQALEKIRLRLKEGGYRVKFKEEEGKILLFAIKHRFQRFGSWVSPLPNRCG